MSIADISVVPEKTQGEQNKDKVVLIIWADVDIWNSVIPSDYEQLSIMLIDAVQSVTK